MSGNQRRFKVVVADWLVPPANIEQEILGDIADVHLLGAESEAECVDRLVDADIVLLWHCVELGRESIEKLERCKGIVRYGAGFDSVDLVAARERGIPVCNVPDYGTDEVADHAIGLLLGLTRGIVVRHTEVAKGSWDVGVGAPPLPRLRGRRMGIVGLGRIGLATARRAAALGMDVVFYDPYVRDGFDKATGTTRVETLAELAAGADVISFHVPLTDETRGMASPAFFRDVRPGAIILNTSRGPVIDDAAFLDALRTGRVWGGGFDVLPVEPPGLDRGIVAAIHRDEPWARGRLVVTPHSAFYAVESLAELREKAVREARRLLLGEKPRNCVNDVPFAI